MKKTFALFILLVPSIAFAHPGTGFFEYIYALSIVIPVLSILVLSLILGFFINLYQKRKNVYPDLRKRKTFYFISLGILVIALGIFCTVLITKPYGVSIIVVLNDSFSVAFTTSLIIYSLACKIKRQSWLLSNYIFSVFILEILSIVCLVSYISYVYLVYRII
ncbi:MAG: hypothetical protein WCP15_04025 [bacterium]